MARLQSTRVFFLAMAAFWGVFGLITTFVPSLMDLFQTPAGVAAGTAFSDHVWLHGGLDILALCILLVALSAQPVRPALLRAAGLAALMPTIAILYSLVATPFWSPLFLGAGVACAAFVLWAFALARWADRRPDRGRGALTTLPTT